MMTKEYRKILKEFADHIYERYPDARVYALGFRARGAATWESDFDVFIVLSKGIYKTGLLHRSQNFPDYVNLRKAEDFQNPVSESRTDRLIISDLISNTQNRLT